MSETYTPKNPELSNLEVFKKLRIEKLYDLFLGVGMFSFGLLLLIQLKPFLLFNSVYSFSKEMIYPFLYIALLISVILLLLIYFKKSNGNNLIYLLFFIIICPFLYNLQDKSLTIYQIYTPDLFTNLTFLSIIAILTISAILIMFGFLMIKDFFSIFLSEKYHIKNFFEYQSEKKHTGIIIPFNLKRLYDISYSCGLHLANELFNNKTEPFRVYFCSKRQETIDVIKNNNVVNLWIFGHGTKGSVDLTDRPLFYIDLKNMNITKKGYIKQYHCNCEIDKLDELSLCDLFTSNENRELSTDKGNSYILNYLFKKNYRDFYANKKEVDEYIKKMKEPHDNKK